MIDNNKDIKKLRELLLDAIGNCFDWAESESLGWAYDDFLWPFIEIGKTAEKALKEYNKTHKETD